MLYEVITRERMGHIALAVPVVHIWFFRAQPSKIGNIIGLSLKELEKVIYYESYIVINAGPTGLSVNDLISEDQYFVITSYSIHYTKLYETTFSRWVPCSMNCCPAVRPGPQTMFPPTGSI